MLLKVSSHPDSNHLTKWSKCIYILFIYCRRCRTITFSSNHISQSDSPRYDRLSYHPVNICICIPPRTLFTQTWYVHYAIADRVRMKGVIIVILCALYCNVFSVVNERWGNLISLHSIPTFGGGVALESDFAGRVGSYAFKASLLLLAFPKSPAVPLSEWN